MTDPARSSPGRLSRAAGAVRPFVRSLAAAVYVSIAHALVQSWLSLEGWGALTLGALLAAAAAALLVRTTEAPVWAATSVGLWCAAFDAALLFILTGGELDAGVWGALALRGLALVAGALVGALVARRGLHVPSNPP